MGLSDLTAPAVNQAIEEFDQLRRKAFLKKYKFGKAKSYFLKKDDQFYDSKAIASAAHGYLPGRRTLTANDFSGERRRLRSSWSSSGFTVVNGEQQPLPYP